MAAAGPWWAARRKIVMYAPSLTEVMIVLGVLALVGSYLAIWHWALSGPAANGEPTPQVKVATNFAAPPKPAASEQKFAA